MKRTLIAIGLAGLVGGCNSGKKMTYGVPANESVTDIAPPPSPTPVAQPVVYDTMTSTPAPMGASMNSSTSTTPSSITGSSYTVKKGDTLYSIARGKYGDGKQWSKIVSANPGLRPESLKAGQTISLP